MKKKTMKLNLVIFILMPVLLVFSNNVNAGWTHMNGTWEDGDGLYDVWGTSANDVFLSGCFGTRMHYDGNPEETWYEWPEIQGH